MPLQSQQHLDHHDLSFPDFALGVRCRAFKEAKGPIIVQQLPNLWSILRRTQNRLVIF
jgi:hypothetical protein